MATTFTTSFMKARFTDGTGSAETTPAGYWGRRMESEVLASGGGKAATETGRAGDEMRSSQRPGDRALEEEISGGSKGQSQGEQPRRLRRKVAANRRKLQADEFDDHDDMDQDLPTSDNDVKVKLLYKEIENLRLQLALKTKDLKFELLLKTKEIESLQKQNKELKTENENLKKTGKPTRERRKCSYCKQRAYHDTRNCPEKSKPASSSEEKDGEGSG
ncbi:hypothetical protein EJB05_31593, partial [Eragrostis curvula]